MALVLALMLALVLASMLASALAFELSPGRVFMLAQSYSSSIVWLAFMYRLAQL